MPSRRTVICERVKPRTEKLEGAAGLWPASTPGIVSTASLIRWYPRVSMTALSTTSIEAGMSMARRPSRLPVAVSSASPSSLGGPGDQHAFLEHRGRQTQVEAGRGPRRHREPAS